MKAITYAVIIFLCISTVSLYGAEEKKPEKLNAGEVQSLFGGSIHKLQLGGYGGIEGRVIQTGRGWNMLLGGRGGLIFNHCFVIGAGGYGLLYNRSIRGVTGKQLVWDDRLDLGYGGGLMEFHFFSTKIVHFSIGSLVGAGEIVCYPPYDNRRKRATFFIAEPEFYLYVNLFKYCRFGLSGSYRFVSHLNKRGVTNGDFSGFSVGLSIQGGYF